MNILLNHKKYEFGFRDFQIHVYVNENSYKYHIIHEGKVIRDYSFSTPEELLNSKIIANQTLEELWNELELPTKTIEK